MLFYNIDGDVRAVCDDGFTDKEAEIACKELFGNPTVLSWSQGHDCSAETTFFWLDDLQCSGSENAIIECNHLPLEEHNCDAKNECVKLICAAGGFRDSQTIETITLTHSMTG